ncbi:uncharacterized protein LOC124137616 isoform X2 [Haliotis rufescens]|nr:uncharacterized protein LOC124137616 isoform X2 [Haliotis rufescens]
MLDYYYIIIVILVFLKVIFWTFYFYIRAQRLRTARVQRQFVIVDTRQMPPGYNDRSAIVQHEVLPDTCPGLPPQYTGTATQFPGGPPPYEETQHNQPNKPPSYEQAISGYAPSAPTEATSQAQNPTPVPVVYVETGISNTSQGIGVHGPS